MEDIVGEVFREFFECDVQYCGRSNDGGIDLLILISDNPILVQVKRRQNPRTVEPISLVRDLLGAMFINNSRKGIFVSTADRFSRPSHNIIKKPLSTNKLDYFELINFDRFVEMLSLTRKREKYSWYNLYTQFHDDAMATIKRIDEYFN